ncbi:Fanconi anemia group D2 protein [Trichinella pseudospiralis]|uniref:Fanconi anemia group D2 protein n=1 Tax=Trichinella pseudospiralis TaxID=6337 RepID=A0A0V1IE53_TRIPS|nr:Fanconi anemia group D2 protein [Trichinella pseudospiralis]KRZ38747.1 Fanconi anemia group D2 protein [Trichinella pseudospiralis]KRZ38749.1 Fanconi anemia group D2 protein [Trichinella pseudospiralis]
MLGSRRLPNSRAAIQALKNSQSTASSAVTERTDTLSDAISFDKSVDNNYNNGEDFEYFKNTLADCALIVSETIEKPCILNCDHVKFINELRKRLHNPDDRCKFVDQFNAFIQDQERLKSALLPTELSKNDEGIPEDSMIRLLLRVDELQADVAICLLNILIKQCKSTCSTQEPENEFPQLMINQFRYLERIADSRKLFSHFLKIVEIAPAWIQREIFYCLPELIADDFHDEAGSALLDLMISNPVLTNSIFETICNLTLSLQLTHEIKEMISESLSSIDAIQLPSRVKFLLQCNSLEDAVQTLEILREKLDFIRMFGAYLLPVLKQDEDGSVQEALKLLFSTLETAVHFSKFIAAAILNFYNRKRWPPGEDSLKVFDLIMLFMLTNSRHYKQVKRILLFHIKVGHITGSLLSDTFHFKQLLEPYFSQLIKMASDLFESVELTAQRFASSLYVELFLVYKKDTYREDIITALLDHCTGEKAAVIGCAIDTLLALAENDVDSLCEYDFIIVEDMLFSIQKYAGSPTLGLQSIGVVAALSALKVAFEYGGRTKMTNLHNSKQVDNFTFNKSMQFCKLDETLFNQLLDFICNTTKNSYFLSALVFDELSNIVENTDDQCTLNLQSFERNASDTLAKFICAPNDYNRKFSSDSEIAFGSNDSTTILDVFHSVDISSDIQPSCSTANECPMVICLAPAIRFLRLCAKCGYNNSNVDLNFLTNCPILHVKQCNVQNFSTLNTILQVKTLRTLFHSSNVLREILNTLCDGSSTTASAQFQICNRLGALVDVEMQLSKCTFEFPALELDLFTWDYTCQRSATFQAKSRRQPKTAKTKKKGASKKKKKKVKKSVESEGESRDAVDPITQLSSAEDSNAEDETNEDAINHNQQQQSSSLLLTVDSSSFRELDPSVLFLLRLPLTNNEAREDDNDLHADVATMQVEHLEFLLHDLKQKLNAREDDSKRSHWFFMYKENNKASSTTKKQQRFRQLSQLQFSNFSFLLLPHLFARLEQLRQRLTDLVVSYDGLLDHPQSTTPTHVQNTNCVQLLLTNLLLICKLNANEFKNKDKFKHLLDVESDSVADFVDQLRIRVKYLLKFVDLAGSLQAAATVLQIVQFMIEQQQPYANCVDAALYQEISQVALEVLQREWQCKLTKAGKSIGHILQIYLWSKRTSRLDCLEEISKLSIGDALENNLSSSTYRTLNKDTFAIWYGFYLVELAEDAKNLSQDKQQQQLSTQELFVKWVKSVGLFRLLTLHVLGKVQSKTVLRLALLHAPKYVNAFSEHAVRLLDANFRQLIEEIRPLLHAMQQSTRTLQNACTHLKATKNFFSFFLFFLSLFIYLYCCCCSHLQENKDRTLTKLIPGCKRTLEEFVFRIKAMMVSNNCTDALQIANLKNRNLLGETLMSQSSSEDNDQPPSATPKSQRQSQAASQSGRHTQATCSSVQLKSDVEDSIDESHSSEQGSEQSPASMSLLGSDDETFPSYSPTV